MEKNHIIPKRGSGSNLFSKTFPATRTMRWTCLRVSGTFSGVKTMSIVEKELFAELERYTRCKSRVPVKEKVQK